LFFVGVIRGFLFLLQIFFKINCCNSPVLPSGYFANGLGGAACREARMHPIEIQRRIVIMAEVIDRALKEVPAEDDLVSALQRLLQASPNPLTLAKIRALLPATFRSVSQDALVESLQRQVAAHVFCQYPKYRSSQDRFWDRPMTVHIADLLRAALSTEPLPWSILRRRLPIYAQAQAETVMKELITQKLIFRHPRMGRSAERFGLQPPDAREYLIREIGGVFERLTRLGFAPAELRAGAIELLHEEEWSSTPDAPKSPTGRNRRNRE
jgi:hypothetical protein